MIAKLYTLVREKTITISQLVDLLTEYITREPEGIFSTEYAKKFTSAATELVKTVKAKLAAKQVANPDIEPLPELTKILKRQINRSNLATLLTAVRLYVPEEEIVKLLTGEPRPQLTTFNADEHLKNYGTSLFDPADVINFKGWTLRILSQNTKPYLPFYTWKNLIIKTNRENKTSALKFTYLHYDSFYNSSRRTEKTSVDLRKISVSKNLLKFYFWVDTLRYHSSYGNHSAEYWAVFEIMVTPDNIKLLRVKRKYTIGGQE